MDVSGSAQVTCLCGDVKADGSLINELLPRDALLCHCESCRTSTGALTYSGVSLREAPSDATLGKCRVYATSDRVSRYFCRKCGTHCFYCLTQKGLWRACAGAVEQSPESEGRREPWPENILRVTAHIFAGDTIDYQLPRWWSQLGGRKVLSYVEGPASGLLDEHMLSSPPHRSASDQPADTLAAKCHCGTVELQILRPTWGPATPQLYIPPGADNANKYVAGMCACRSCRLAFGGSSLAPWIYVPEDRILYQGQPLEFSNSGDNITGAVHYVNGKTVRSFCGTCGATVFYWNADRREVVDIATGLLRAPEGATASNWLWWRPPVSWEKEATDKDIVDATLNRET